MDIRERLHIQRAKEAPLITKIKRAIALENEMQILLQEIIAETERHLPFASDNFKQVVAPLLVEIKEHLGE